MQVNTGISHQITLMVRRFSLAGSEYRSENCRLSA